ncbi:alpha/beta fold hydrolase [Zhouia sp. PK063]|uniref:alpha/beta fold hydrolase n=1 Tax=Zhouia sp. PK063 TaxID=3373602 RepID=UPI0037B21EAC
MKTEVVFIHYFGGEAESWKWTDLYLADAINSHFLSLPGFGSTPSFVEPSLHKMAGYVLDYIEQHELDNVVLVGHSMGGKIALLTASIAPKNLISKIILIAPSPPTVEKMPIEERDRMLIHPNEKQARTTVINGTLTTLPSNKMQFAIATQLKVNEITWQWWLKEGMLTSIKAEIENLMLPVFLVYADEDRAITPQMIQEEVLPNISFQKIYKTDKAGHLMPIETPRFIASVINEVCLT